MTDGEKLLRIALVKEAYEAFGVRDDAQIAAVVRLTSGIPWYVPDEGPVLLFARALTHAALSSTFGAFTPAHIMEAAIAIGGRCRTIGGHTTDRRWVAAAKSVPNALRIPEAKLLSVPTVIELAEKVKM